MKRTTLAVIFVLALLLCACGGESAVKETAAPAESAVKETAAPEESMIEETAAPEESDAPVEPEDIRVTFKSEYMGGGAVDESIFAGHELIMLNFWEPWCGPCVGELPALQQLSEDYADRGLLLIGVYSTEDGAADIIASSGVTYPIIKYTDDFAVFQTGYVPTTVFLDGEGRYLAGPYIGSGDYDYWREQVEALYEK